MSFKGADFEFNYDRGYPVLINHKEETEFVMNVAETIPEVRELKKLNRSWAAKTTPTTFKK